MCFCAQRAIERERAACRNKWEALWLDQRRVPDNFPPTPIPRSSLCESLRYLLRPRSTRALPT